jgi:uncharacterized protein (DUF58 family)
VDWKASAKSGALKAREFAREEERRVLLAIDPHLFAGATAGGAPEDKLKEQFERAVSFCACLAWHFYEIDSVIGFSTHGADVSVGPAAENVYDILRQLATIQPSESGSSRDFLKHLASEPNIFKIVLTSQPRGSIPTTLWTSAYLVFFDSL